MPPFWMRKSKTEKVHLAGKSASRAAPSFRGDGADEADTRTDHAGYRRCACFEAHT
jgi:hypothetical protein